MECSSQLAGKFQNVLNASLSDSSLWPKARRGSSREEDRVLAYYFEQIEVSNLSCLEKVPFTAQES